MNEFKTFMEIREKVSDLICSLEEIPDAEIKSDNIDYAIKMLQELKNEKIKSE